MTYEQYIAKFGVKFSCEQIDARPDRPKNQDKREIEWDLTASHYRCKFAVGRKSMTVYFSQGSAIHYDPTAATVLSCIAADVASFESAISFEHWCSDFGYDTDSRRAEHCYKQIEKQHNDLIRLLGATAVDDLLYQTSDEERS